MHRSRVDRCEFVRVEVCPHGGEEDLRAISLQLREPRLVMSLPRVPRVVCDLGPKPGGDGVTVRPDTPFRQRVHQRRHGIDEGDQCPVCVDRDGVELRGAQATHCHNAHCTTATPSSTALHAATAVCSRGRPAVTAARARNNGKITSPNRGSESSGQRALG